MNNEEVKLQSGQGYYIGVKMIKARKAWMVNGNDIIYDLNHIIRFQTLLKLVKVMFLDL